MSFRIHAIARKLAVRLYWKLRKQLVPPARMQGSPEILVVGASRSSY
jgi:hypothetical protein